MTLVDLLILVVIVAVFVWLLLLLPPVKPFANIVYGIAAIIIIFAAISALFGINILAHMRSLGGR